MSELKISGVFRIILRYFFLFLNENIYFDPSLELSQRDSAETVLMMGHKICFYGEIPLIIPKLAGCYPFLYGALPVWSFAVSQIGFYHLFNVNGYLSGEIKSIIFISTSFLERG